MRLRLELTLVLSLIAATATLFPRGALPRATPFSSEIPELGASMASQLLDSSSKLQPFHLVPVESIFLQGCYLGMPESALREKWPEVKAKARGNVTFYYPPDAALRKSRHAVVREGFVVSLTGFELQFDSTVLRKGQSVQDLLKILGEPSHKSRGMCGQTVLEDWVYQVEGGVLCISVPNEAALRSGLSQELLNEPKIRQFLNSVQEVSIDYKHRVRLI